MRWQLALLALWFAVPAAAQLAPKAVHLAGPVAADVQLARDEFGQVRWAQGDLGALDAGMAGVQPALARLGGWLGTGPHDELWVAQDELDRHGNRHLRVRRRFFGVAVAFDQLRLHARDGRVYALEAEWSDLHGLAAPRGLLLPAVARQKALPGQGVRLTDDTATALLVVGSSALPGGPHYVYRSRIAFDRGPHQPPYAADVFADARTGQRLLELTRVRTDGVAATMTSPDLYGNDVTLQVQKFKDGVVLKNVTAIAGGSVLTVNGAKSASAYVTSDLATPFDDPQAVSVAANVATALGYYKDQFGFGTWNLESKPAGPGGAMIAIAHYGKSFANAFFSDKKINGTVYGLMAFGDGDGETFTPLGKCLDITGHEMGHAIVSATADLAYHNQSGALNESMADVFGWQMDPANTTIGEDCMASGLPPLRDLCNPAAGYSSQPATMAEFKKTPDTEDGDYGGVHDNSGIANRAACVAGQALGNGKLGKLWFAALKFHLGETSGFADMVNATKVACTEAKLSASDCAAVGNAWAEVGLATKSTAANCPPHSSANGDTCYCDKGYKVDAAGKACVAEASAKCPSNAHAVGEDCYCDSGYVPDSAGGCRPEFGGGGGACPAHSHLESGDCVCDPCFQGSVTGDGGACKPIKGCQVCKDPAAKPNSASCDCIDGVDKDSDGQCTVPIAGDCGGETFVGRCVANTLIYCNDTDAAKPKQVSVINCDDLKEPSACGFDEEGAGFDCVPKSSECGGVAATGTCAGSTAQWCDAGTLHKLDCGADGCGAVTFQGVALQFCRCPAHAAYNKDGACQCDSGYLADGDHCQPLDAGMAGSGGGAGGGALCTAGRFGNWSGALAGVLLALAALWLRRRQAETA